MAYFSGQVNSIEDLRSVLIDACVSSGYTLAGSILVKGKINIRVQTSSNGRMTFEGGTGVGAGNALTGICPSFVQIGANQSLGIAWPSTYEIFVLSNPDEVYLMLNYSVDRYQWAAWGVSNVSGVPGTGMWFGASLNQDSPTNQFGFTQFWSSLTAPGVYSQPGLFWRSHQAALSGPQYLESFIHVGMDDQQWAAGGGSANPGASAAQSAIPLLQRLPSAWNSEAVLLPIQVWLPRPSSKMSLVADLAHSRYTRIDYYEPKQIITLGQDRWRVYPFVRKDTINRDGMINGTNNYALMQSGTFGLAIRYDGA